MTSLHPHKLFKYLYIAQVTTFKTGIVDRIYFKQLHLIYVKDHMLLYIQNIRIREFVSLKSAYHAYNIIS